VEKSSELTVNKSLLATFEESIVIWLRSTAIQHGKKLIHIITTESSGSQPGVRVPPGVREKS